MKLFLLLFVLVFLGCTSRNVPLTTSLQTDDNRTIEQKLADHVIPLADNHSFAFLDKMVKDKRLLFLGESTHQDKKTFETKVNMIRYLNQKHGFKTIGLEGANYFDSYVANKFGWLHTDRKWNIKFLWLPLWSETKESEGLVDLIDKGEITYFGLDNNVLLPNTVAGIRNIIERYDRQKEITLDWDLLNEQYQTICWECYRKWKETNISALDQLKFMDHLNTIKNLTHKLLTGQRNNQDLQFVLLAIDNMKSAFRQDHINRGRNLIADPLMLALGNNERDGQMAANITHYLETHPKERVIIWCANLHGARDLSQVLNGGDWLLFARTKPVGEYLANKYGEQMYSIAFTSPRDGQAALFEQELAEYRFGFIDFVPLRYRDEFFNQPFESNAIRKDSGNWMYMWDGFYYIRDQKQE